VKIAQHMSYELNRPKLMLFLKPPSMDEKISPFLHCLQEIREMINNFKYATAVERLNMLLGSESSDLIANEGLCQGWIGECYFHLRKPELSIAPMSKALQISLDIGDQEGIPQYMKNLVEVYRYMNDKKEASFWCERLSKWYSETGDKSMAFFYMRRAKKITEGEPLNRIVVYIGNTLYELEDILPNQLTDRVSPLRFVFQRNRISLAPCSDMVRRGRSLVEQGYHKEGIECFRKGSEFDPLAPEPFYEEAMLCIQLGQFDRALDCFKKVELLAPGWYKVRSYLWLSSQVVLGKFDRRVIEAAKALEDGAYDEVFKTNLASSMSGKYPDIPLFYLLEGLSLTRLNDKPRAERILTEGILRCGENRELADTKTSLLFALATVTPDPVRKQLLLQEAYTLNGNLNCAAMAYVTNTLRLQ